MTSLRMSGYAKLQHLILQTPDICTSLNIFELKNAENKKSSALLGHYKILYLRHLFTAVNF